MKHFIGYHVDKSINDDKEWSASWSLLKTNIESLSPRSFYLSLSYTFFSILQLVPNNIPLYLLNEETRVSYKRLREEYINLFFSYFDTLLFVINGKEISSANKIQLKNDIKDIYNGETCLLHLFTKYFSKENSIQNLLPLNIKEWVKISHVYWLWFHITGAILITQYPTNKKYETLLLQLFVNLDIYIYCINCRNHFKNLKYDNNFTSIIHSNKDLDEKIIQIHSIIKANQDKLSLGEDFNQEDYLNDYRTWSKNIFVSM